MTGLSQTFGRLEWYCRCWLSSASDVVDVKLSIATQYDVIASAVAPVWLNTFSDPSHLTIQLQQVDTYYVNCRHHSPTLEARAHACA